MDSSPYLSKARKYRWGKNKAYRELFAEHLDFASDFPEITKWLVERGIGSISLNPDSVLRMTEVVLEMEKAKKG